MSGRKAHPPLSVSGDTSDVKNLEEQKKKSDRTSTEKQARKKFRSSEVRERESSVVPGVTVVFNAPLYTQHEAMRSFLNLGLVA